MKNKLTMIAMTATIATIAVTGAVFVPGVSADAVVTAVNKRITMEKTSVNLVLMRISFPSFLFASLQGNKSPRWLKKLSPG